MDVTNLILQHIHFCLMLLLAISSYPEGNTTTHKISPSKLQIKITSTEYTTSQTKKIPHSFFLPLSWCPVIWGEFFFDLQPPTAKKIPRCRQQEGTHDSIQDAKTALRLYMLKSKAGPGFWCPGGWWVHDSCETLIPESFWLSRATFKKLLGGDKDLEI